MTGAASIIITMAGFGTRFRDAGYDCPKYMIEARGRSLFDWSVGSLADYARSGSPFVFIVRRADAAKGFIEARSEALGITSSSIIELDAPTDGQATTARLALDSVASDAPFAIFNIDTAIDPSFLASDRPYGDGFIPCFDGPGTGWSFVRIDETGRAVEIREKKRISNHATIGFYWFRSAALYAEVYDRYYRDGERLEMNERYVAPLYNQMVEDGLDVRIDSLPVEAVRPIGTPAELQQFVG